MEDFEKLRAELDMLLEKLNKTEFDDAKYDVLVQRIAEIQKILNSDTELREKINNAEIDFQERKKDARKRRIGGILKFFGMAGLYIGAEAMVLHAEESRPIITKALNMPKDILKLNDKG